MSIDGLKGEVRAISFNGYPVGAIEIKRPGKSCGRKELASYGQLFDYMMCIRSFH
jgi:hypothetical protein